MGRTKGLELAKVAPRDGQYLDCATCFHRAREMPEEDSRREVEKEMTGRRRKPLEAIWVRDGRRGKIELGEGEVV